MTFNAADFAGKAKKRAARAYLGVLDQLDPEVARHILGFQREMFLAGQAFFEEEVRHADKALEKLERKERQKGEDEG